MMNLLNSYDVFKPEQVSRVHIIGCGSVGSTMAENIARLGVETIYLYDFDKVEERNITNQMFTVRDIGELKVDAVERMIKDINPQCKIEKFPHGYTNEKLVGYVFLCVDNIDTRREIATNNKLNADVKAFFDVRTSLYEAQHFAADWEDYAQIKSFLNSMDFTQESVKDTNIHELSACGTSLSVNPTIRVICGLATANFMNFVNNGDLKTTIIANPFKQIFNVFKVGE